MVPSQAQNEDNQEVSCLVVLLIGKKGRNNSCVIFILYTSCSSGEGRKKNQKLPQNLSGMHDHFNPFHIALKSFPNISIFSVFLFCTSPFPRPFPGLSQGRSDEALSQSDSIC